MAGKRSKLNNNGDAFAGIANYYDAIMGHVDYDRWALIASELANLLPPHFNHLDVACGTGHLMEILQDAGWNSIGLDLSASMARTAAQSLRTPRIAVADMRALPIRESVNYITCLFDSVNFLLTENDVRSAMNAFAGALTDGGVLYFDTVTERMIVDHFADQKWTEQNQGFQTTWDSKFDRAAGLSVTEITVSHGERCTVREQVYAPSVIDDAIAGAGLALLGAFDAETWRKPRKKTVRIEYVAAKNPTKDQRRNIKTISQTIRSLMR